ncbi:MAG: AarF/UbiB family protein [Thermoanaerobaculia bacterium]
MIEPAPSKTARARRADRAAAQVRRREVERRLVEAGLGRGPRGLAGEAPHFDGGFGRRLRLALETLGPVFSAFGRYLGSRADLLPLADCFELRQTEEAAEPMSPAAVHALVESETGVPLGEAFGEIEAAPLCRGLLLQTHRARLPDGRGALVQLVRPDCGASLEADLPHLPLLAVAFGREGRPFPIEQAINDFQRALAARADLPAVAVGLRALRIEVARLGTLRLPRIVLATPRLLCLELLEGASLASLQPSPATPAESAERADLARRLWLAWLYHVVHGKAFPVEIEPGLVLLADGGIGLQGGTFASLPAESQPSLQAYLEAAAADDPDEACKRLLHEMQPAPAGAEVELRQRLRQSVAFRDGGWGSARDGQSLSEQLFVQWRLAAELGFLPLPHLEAFYRGLFALAVIVRPLAPPESDPLREALESLRLLGVADQLGEMADFSRLRRGFAGYAAVLADLPMMMDGALSLLGEGRPRLRIEVDQPSTGGKGSGKSLPLALALALGAVALVTVRLGTVQAAGPWFQAVGATLFTILGGLLLWTLGRQS